MNNKMDNTVVYYTNQGLLTALKSGLPYNVQNILLEEHDKAARRYLLNRRFKLGHHEYLTPLMIAIKYHKFDLFRFLLHEYDVDIEGTGDVMLKHQDKFSCDEVYVRRNVTPLWYACSIKCNHNPSKKCFANLLVECGANTGATSDDMSTPLHMACYSGNVTLIEYLLQNGANPNVCNNTSSQTPLLCSVPIGLTYKIGQIIYNIQNSNILDIVTTLVSYGADINARTQQGCLTLLHYAAEADDLELAQYLIENGAIVTKDSKTLTPIHCAGLFGSERVYYYFAQLSQQKQLHHNTEMFFSKQDQIEGLELMAAYCFANATPQKCYELLRKALKAKPSENLNIAVLPKVINAATTIHQGHCFINGSTRDHQCTSLQELLTIENNVKALQLECMYILARIHGPNSIHFASALFEIGEDTIEDATNSITANEGIQMMKQALDIMCLNHKMPTYLLTAYLDVHMMYHLNSIDACNSTDHNPEHMMEIITMCKALLQHALDNPFKMAAGRTFLWDEVLNIYKAIADALCLLLSHSTSNNSGEIMNYSKRKIIIQGFIELSDELVTQGLSEFSFLQWLLTTAKNQSAISINNGLSVLPEKLLDTILLALECGADTNVYSFNCNTALHIMAEIQDYFTLSEFKTLLQSFLHNGAHIDIVNSKGQTALEISEELSISIPKDSDLTQAEEKTYLYAHLQNNYISLKCLAAQALKKYGTMTFYSSNGVLPTVLQQFVQLH